MVLFLPRLLTFCWMHFGVYNSRIGYPVRFLAFPICSVNVIRFQNGFRLF